MNPYGDTVTPVNNSFINTSTLLSSGNTGIQNEVLPAVTVTSMPVKKTDGTAVLFGLAIVGVLAYKLWKK